MIFIKLNKIFIYMFYIVFYMNRHINSKLTYHLFYIVIK